MRFIIDYRERNAISLVKKFLENYEIFNLPVGDFLICFENYGVLVERKTPQDLLNSIKTNRLWDQLNRLRSDEVIGCEIRRRSLLIHGKLEEAVQISGFGWNHIMGTFMEIQYNYDIPVFYAYNDDAFIEFFKILIKREASGKNGGDIEKKWMRIPPKRTMTDEEWKIYSLSSLPYIGEKLAKNLLDHFGSIEKIARANIIELRKVEGIGEKKAKQIYRIFH